MPTCAVCDTELKPEQKTCHVCGSNVESTALTEQSGALNIALPPAIPSLPKSQQEEQEDAEILTLSEERECPACGQKFGADYQDEFCRCGTELQASSTSNLTSTPQTSPPPIPSASVTPTESTGVSRPPVGTVCLVIYSDAKPRQPVRYVPILKDVLSIGREDAVRGDFPDLDLSAVLDESQTKKVSRRHAEVLRARDSQTYRLRPLPGNTGTQIGKELATPGQEYPLADGTPIVLGGVVWMKFEIVK
jgi:hypothetical protein